MAATVEDLYRTPDDGTYKLVNGRLMHTPPLGFQSGRVAQSIRRSLLRYEETIGNGYAVGGKIGFIVRQPRLRSFRADAAYIAEILEETDDFVEGAPIFAVEVRSKGDYGPAHDAEYAAKCADYFAAGTRVVWDVSPRAQSIARYRADAPDAPRLFRADEIADAEPALPNWRMAVRDIFRT